MKKWVSVLFGIIPLDIEIDIFSRIENSFEINIPIFHHSIIPYVRQKEDASIDHFNFSALAG